MRFGIFSFSRAPYEELVERFRRAEALGFASAWVDDDLLGPHNADFEPWTLLGALARDTKCLSERLDDFCREVGRDPATVRRSVQALNPMPDPFASLDAFDEYVGAYQEIGINEVIFYWPPIAYFAERGSVLPEEQARFERIVLERVAAR